MTNVVALEAPRKVQIASEYIRIDSVFEMTRFVQKEIRESKMKYSAIAKKASCNPQTVSRIASGDTKDPRTGTVIRILFALGRSVHIR